MEYQFPYADVPRLVVPDGNLMGIFSAQECRSCGEPEEIVRAALAAPIGTPRLAELARTCRPGGAESVLLVVDDNSRPTPVHLILPPIIEELHAAGVADGCIEVLLALGTHRFMTRAEIEAKLGPDIAARYPVHNHDWKDPASCELIGTTAQGVDVWINRRVARADLVIGVGRIMPLEVSGFTGGGKILVPGVCGKLTNDEMHWTRMDVPDEQVIGQRDNPVRASIDALARAAGLDFIVNVVMDSRARILHAVAGDMVEAHRAGCARALDAHAVRFPAEPDIVVADSYPFDIEFWQANKALDQAGLVVRTGGVLILVAPCTEGFSATHRELIDFGYPPVEEIKRMVAEGRIIDKVVAVHMTQVSRVARERATVILVTRGISEGDVRKVGLEYAATPQAALEAAFGIAGRDARVALLRGAAEMLPIVPSHGGVRA
jgi:nickel-dependent lactate racemase